MRAFGPLLFLLSAPFAMGFVPTGRIVESPAIVATATGTFVRGDTRNSMIIPVAVEDQTRSLGRSNCPLLLRASSASKENDEGDGFRLEVENYLYGVVWLALFTWTTLFAPGQFGDLTTLDAILANPAAPDLNGLFYTAFNEFGIVPVTIACILLPRKPSRQQIPAAPFLWLGSFIGYFALGPYLVLRGKVEDTIDVSSLGFATKSIFENKIFNYAIAAFSLYFVAAFTVPQFLDDPRTLVDGFVHLISTDRFSNVAVTDLVLLTSVASLGIIGDYKARKPDDADRAPWIAASTLLLPVAGSALYCAFRPPLPEGE